MKLFSFYSFVLCLLSAPLLSQDTLTFYYDKDWNEIQNKEEAVYYRKAFMTADKLWSVRDYYISNKIQMTGTYKSKKLEVKHGHFVYYYENGQKESEGDYVNGENSGTWTHWYENGQKEYGGTYIGNEAEGIWEYWHENGTKASEGKYLKSAKNGLWRYWYPNGILKFEEDYKNENICTTKGYSENGKMILKGGFVNGKRQGEWIFYNVDGRVYFQGKFNNGYMEGEWIRTFKDGSMKINYNKGIALGKQFGGIVGRE